MSNFLSGAEDIKNKLGLLIIDWVCISEKRDSQVFSDEYLSGYRDTWMY